MRVNEIFYSIQGEGRYTGTPAIFIRLAGCNLRCNFCDTEHLSLIHRLRNGAGKFVQVETNGTIPIKCYLPVDWITCSPKFDFCPHAELRLQRIDELKVVYQGQDMTAYDGIEAKEYYLQPCDFKDEARNAENLAATINYIKSHPKWKLSLQTQKILSVR